MHQTVTQRIERARAYVADVRAGRVSHADEGPEAVAMTLSSYADDLLGVLDGLHLEDP
jgi:hypothetical protein